MGTPLRNLKRLASCLPKEFPNYMAAVAVPHKVDAISCQQSLNSTQCDDSKEYASAVTSTSISSLPLLGLDVLRSTPGKASDAATGGRTAGAALAVCELLRSGDLPLARLQWVGCSSCHEDGTYCQS